MTPTTDRVRVFARAGQIHLAGLQEGDVISVYDLLGHCLLTKTAADSTERIAVKRQGMMMVRIASNGETTQTEKVVM